MLGFVSVSADPPAAPETPAGLDARRRRKLVVVVQAVAGSSPVAHPHKVAAQGMFLCQRDDASAPAELPMSYQFLVGASWCVSLDLRVTRSGRDAGPEQPERELRNGQADAFIVCPRCRAEYPRCAAASRG
jgi:hypothetical protein